MTPQYTRYVMAFEIAEQAHQGQTMLNGVTPYIEHIRAVLAEVWSVFIKTKKARRTDLLVLTAILHNTLEDASLTYEEIKRLFGLEIADGVLALTKNPQIKGKHNQLIDSIKRIKTQPQEIWMVKMCDRIVNLNSNPIYWSTQKKPPT